MTTTASATSSATVMAPLDRAWAIGTPMTPVGYYPKFGPLPEVLEVRRQTGPWDAPGQSRQLMLSDGGSVVETVVRVEEPHTMVYELSNFEKLFGRLVKGARAEWEYTAVGKHSHIEWTYTFFARPGAGLALRGIVRFFWAPYMEKVLPGIVAQIEREA